MLLKKNGKYLEICDTCLEEGSLKQPYKIVNNEKQLFVCHDCQRAAIRFNSIKRLKWYMTLYKYQKEGYKRL